FARYLRAKGYILRGTPEFAQFDLDRARELALDPALERLLAPEVETGRPAASALSRLPIETRQRWRATAANQSNLDRMDRVSRITIHHSALYFRDYRPSATAVQLQRIQREHMRGRGYGDIGYHFLIDPAGRIWQGRDLRWQGAHASGENNVRNAGICLLGNFVRGNRGHSPTAEQVDALESLVAALCSDYRIARSQIHSHSDFKATECPGPLMEPIIARLRGDASNARIARRD
ncbi:MAG: N-acetylmuramoyl-L-alanine amidase, partial [Planctomycetes bacterium]|nr:N-acetylmuramoyl-L-alanine amidase [Planctomycetota bacterium]